MARPRIPKSIKIAQGTLQNCRSNDNAPVFGVIKSIPDPPDFFNEKSRDIYYNTGLDLVNQGVLTSVSLPQFIHYCYFAGAAMELMEIVKSQGYYHHNKGQRVTNPNIKTINAFAVLSRAFASEFGLTPATSEKITAIGKKTSKLDDFLS